MDKVLDISWGAWGNPLVWGPPYRVVTDDVFHKLACGNDYDPRIASYLRTATYTPRDLVMVVTPLGAFETWGHNTNGDAFQRHHIEPENPNAGHKSFETYARFFMHHVNKDPERGFGYVPKAIFEPMMRRIEMVLWVDREKAEQVGARHVVADIDNGKMPDLSMGCRVSFDVCSICGNRAKNVGEYCVDLKTQMCQVLPDGRPVCAFNPDPKFFDISAVFVKAAKEAAVLEKIASAWGSKVIPSAVMAGLAKNMEKIEAGLQKTASDKSADTKLADIKLAELMKFFPAIYSKVVYPVYRSEEALPDPVQRHLCGCRLPEVLSTANSLGMILRPEEFQRAFLHQTGESDLAEVLHSRGQVFAPNLSERGRYVLSPRDISDHVLGVLSRFLPSRSLLQPFVSRRIVVVMNGQQPQVQRPLVEKTGGALDEVGRQYARYLNGLTRLPLFLKQAMDIRGDIYDDFLAASFDPMTKVSNFKREILYPALGLFLPTYLFAARVRREMMAGQDVGPVQQFIAEHPTLVTLGLLTGAYHLGRPFAPSPFRGAAA